MTLLEKGPVADAEADLVQANELDPKYAYAAIWLDIAERRNRLPSRLPALSAKLDMTAWPAPVVRHFMGEMDLAALLASASDPDPVKARGQLCEARFYGGELALLNGGKADAGRLFRLAASECPKDFAEWRGANAGLRSLDGAPSSADPTAPATGKAGSP
jgi:lipoprotein NlpI